MCWLASNESSVNDAAATLSCWHDPACEMRNEGNEAVAHQLGQHEVSTREMHPHRRMLQDKAGVSETPTRATALSKGVLLSASCREASAPECSLRMCRTGASVLWSVEYLTADCMSGYSIPACYSLQPCHATAECRLLQRDRAALTELLQWQCGPCRQLGAEVWPCQPLFSCSHLRLLHSKSLWLPPSIQAMGRPAQSRSYL